ncbi:hypothetical protein SISNIDRAFT_467673 [Sistotremastrum niveocremeum HHB9708]|uniref:Ig-like domain-containing protein n=1 Tax=Sistotremastrum niveocremeum HHB9708 TaxID=1314777 RepID=A0A164SF73_9AGAM|nr:hypothetical protein SISNIDRAFT_467673 [Sistotremastrum niveocremeum HHB9708]
MSTSNPELSSCRPSEKEVMAGPEQRQILSCDFAGTARKKGRERSVRWRAQLDPNAAIVPSAEKFSENEPQRCTAKTFNANLEMTISKTNINAQATCTVLVTRGVDKTREIRRLGRYWNSETSHPQPARFETSTTTFKDFTVPA